MSFQIINNWNAILIMSPYPFVQVMKSTEWGGKIDWQTSCLLPKALRWGWPLALVVFGLSKWQPPWSLSNVCLRCFQFHKTIFSFQLLYIFFSSNYHKPLSHPLMFWDACLAKKFNTRSALFISCDNFEFWIRACKWEDSYFFKLSTMK